MKKDFKIYICRHCGNIIVKLENSGVPVVCCGEKMELLEPGVVDAATEKHIPVIEINGDLVIVKVGEVPHPMTPEHHISWIILVTETGYEVKYLEQTSPAEATFKTDSKVLEVYEYCNLHGLWKKQLF